MGADGTNPAGSVEGAVIAYADAPAGQTCWRVFPDIQFRIIIDSEATPRHGFSFQASDRSYKGSPWRYADLRLAQFEDLRSGA